MENSRRCVNCNIDVDRASFAIQLRNMKLLEIEKDDAILISEWLFEELIENKLWKLYNPKPLKQVARDKMKLDDKQLKKQLPGNKNIP